MKKQPSESARPWYHLHLSTWFVGEAMVLMLVLIIVPGRYQHHNAFAPFVLFQEHGWPLVFLDRSSSYIPGGLPVRDAQEYLASQGLDEGVRRAKSMEGFIEPGTERLGAPWCEGENWPTGGTIWIFKTALLLDTLTALGIVGIVVATYEWWRRRHWRYSLRFLLMAMLVTASPLAWIFGQYQLESRAVSKLHEAGLSVSVTCRAPVWLKMLIGESRLSAFDRVVDISSPYGGGEGTADDRLGRQCIQQLVANARRLRCIDSLSLEGLPVTDDDLDEFSRWSEVLSSLSGLRLDRTAITDQGFLQLARLKHLQFLSVHETEVTATAIATLKSQLPECEIWHD